MQRQIAYKIIYKTISDESFTNLLMRKELEKLPPINRPFVTNLVNSVLKNYDYLIYQQESLYDKCNIKNKIILAMATYEKFYLNEKDYVVNNEYVKLAKSEYDKAFINATLKNIKEIKISNKEHINNSIPEWLYCLLAKQYSKDELNIILENYKRIPVTYYHLNKNKCSFKDLNKYQISIIDDYVFTCKKSLLETDEFKNGYFYVQDINANKLVKEFNFKENDTFLDACAAPGSKLYNALDYLKQENVYGNDINEVRVNLIKEKARILGYEDINLTNYDASEIDKYLDMKFDKILLDVPCSGLGVIGRRPDIKFHITGTALDDLQSIQSKILDSASKLLKNGGELIYSTCTLNKKENTKQIQAFLNRNNEYELVKEETLLNLQGDLFYLAKLKKV